MLKEIRWVNDKRFTQQSTTDLDSNGYNRADKINYFIVENEVGGEAIIRAAVARLVRRPISIAV